MSTTDYSEIVHTARDYYNSDDADNFYFTIWGGEDIHIGLYTSPGESISDASRRTVETMAGKLSALAADARILDIGAGYGGAARYLAKTHGCNVVALNLSEKENERDREMNREQGLDDRIEVVDASFENIPFPDAAFDIVWSQDAILHSGERARVIEEAARVLKPGGELIFTDIMQKEDVSPDVLQPVYDRIHLPNLGSLEGYRAAAKASGLEEVGYTDLVENLPVHYGRVKAETERRQDEIKGLVSDEYVTRMKTGLQHWVDAGNAGRLDWGILHFRKPA